MFITILIPILTRPSRLTRPCFKHFTNVHSLNPHNTPVLVSFYRWRDCGKDENSVMSGSTTVDKVPDRHLLKQVQVGWEGCLASSRLPSVLLCSDHLLNPHLLWQEKIGLFSFLGLLFFFQLPLFLEKTLISWQLGNAIAPRKRDGLTCLVGLPGRVWKL